MYAFLRRESIVFIHFSKGSVTPKLKNLCPSYCLFTHSLLPRSTFSKLKKSWGIHLTTLYLGLDACGVSVTVLKWHDGKFVWECYSSSDAATPSTPPSARLAQQTCQNHSSTRKGWLYRRKYNRLAARALASSPASAFN